MITYLREVTSPVSPYLIALDLGTTSAKAYSITPDGKVLRTHHEFLTSHFGTAGEAEQDALNIIEAVKRLLKHVVIDDHPCLGISLSAAMHSLLAVDEDGTPLTPAMLWSDTRSTSIAEQLRHSYAQKIYSISGTPVHPFSPLSKLHWLRQFQHDVFRSAHRFVSLKEMVVHYLTGQWTVDQSIASATGFFDVDQRVWSEEILRDVGISSAKLSTVVPSDTRLSLLADVAKSMNLSTETPVIIGASDGCLAQWGSDALTGDIAITLGTSGAVRIASSKRPLDPDGKLFTYILNNQHWICGGATNAGTAILDWFRTTFEPNAPTNLEDYLKPVSSIAPGSDGLLALPFMLGERAPVYDAAARGVFDGISIHHTTLHFRRALMEGIAFELRWILESLEERMGKRDVIRLGGGITHSPTWVQCLSDILGRDILVMTGIDSSAWGAALMGFRAIGYPLPPSSHSQVMIHPVRQHAEIYLRLFDRYKKLYHPSAVS